MEAARGRKEQAGWPQALAAELLGQSGQLGVVSPGALADLVAVRGDPLADMKVVEHPVLVVIDGQVFHQEPGRL